MTFEEFFKKKRIDLVALSAGEPVLFSDFKNHFEQMGEKSFDHTKKYWFNKVRHQFPLPPEVKTEKLHLQNPLAEQTITESLIESTTAKTPGSATLAFAPKFKAGSMFKPVANSEKQEEEEIMPGNIEDILNKQSIENTSDMPQDSETKPAYKPRFKMQHIKPNPGTDK